jgi:hypothetical protein
MLQSGRYAGRPGRKEFFSLKYQFQPHIIKAILHFSSLITNKIKMNTKLPFLPGINVQTSLGNENISFFS